MPLTGWVAGKLGFNSATALEPWRTDRFDLVIVEAVQLQLATALEPWRTRRMGGGIFGAFAASIRRRRWSRGDAAGSGIAGALAPGFNSATALEPWRMRVAPGRCWAGIRFIRRRRWSRGERGCFGPAAPIIELQFGHGVGAMQNRHPCRWRRSAESGFNSATAPGAVENHGTQESGSRRNHRFDSATALEPWRTKLFGPLAVPIIELQFGHGVGAVENSGGLLLAAGHPGASIRPRRWSRGEPRAAAAKIWPHHIVLQFGHGVGAVENAVNALTDAVCDKDASIRPRRWSRGRTQQRPAAARVDGFTLQFGHGVGAVENGRGRRHALLGRSGASIRPRRWSRGEPQGNRRGPSPCRTVLRFGHGVGAVENARRRVVGNPLGAVASIRPRRWSRGEPTPNSLIKSPLLKLQFGHGVGAVENVKSKAELKAKLDASIRPRRWSRGEPRAAKCSAPRGWGFNSATALEPWRTFARPELNPLAGLVFNSATALEPWRTANPGSLASGRHRRFNSATALEPWRTRPINRPSPPSKRLQFGHGVGAVESSPRSVAFRLVSMLQFGHGVGAVENVASFSFKAAVASCFNSATALEPWRTAFDFTTTQKTSLLQFGHGVGAVENPHSSSSNGRRQCFNSATALEPWRTDLISNCSVSSIGFNSATALEPWRTTSRSSRTRPRRSGFNSATALEPWRTRTLGTVPCLGNQLQFGHGVGAVENALCR